MLGTPSDTEQNCQIHLACPEAGSVHGNVNMQRTEVTDLSLSETNAMLLRGRWVVCLQSLRTYLESSWTEIRMLRVLMPEMTQFRKIWYTQLVGIYVSLVVWREGNWGVEKWYYFKKLTYSSLWKVNTRHFMLVAKCNQLVENVEAILANQKKNNARLWLWKWLLYSWIPCCLERKTDLTLTCPGSG